MDKDKKEPGVPSGRYLTLGLCFGVFFGIVFHRLTLCILLGLAFGALIDYLAAGKKRT